MSIGPSRELNTALEGTQERSLVDDEPAQYTVVEGIGDKDIWVA
jgi:hypothetical protein